MTSTINLTDSALHLFSSQKITESVSRSYYVRLGFHDHDSNDHPYMPQIKANIALKEILFQACSEMTCSGELKAIRKQNAFSAVLSTEGRVVTLCWDKFKPRGPKGHGTRMSAGPHVGVRNFDRRGLAAISDVRESLGTNPPCRLLIVPLFRGSSRFESLIVSHHSR